MSRRRGTRGLLISGHWMVYERTMGGEVSDDVQLYHDFARHGGHLHGQDGVGPYSVGYQVGIGWEIVIAQSTTL